MYQCQHRAVILYDGFARHFHRRNLVQGTWESMLFLTTTFKRTMTSNKNLIKDD